MQSWRKKKVPRATRLPAEVLQKTDSLLEKEQVIDRVSMAKAQKLSEDPVNFFSQLVGFQPTNYQADFIKLFQENQFVAARWCRQSGKSWIISALLLWYAITNPDSYIAVVGPSWRQTRLIIRRITFFLRKVPPKMFYKPLKTVIRFSNGSCIEAFPCNPDTIRGPTLNVVYCDEMNFLPDDEEMYDAILFTLGTTNGKFVCSSTPWNTDSVFYKIFNHKDYEDFAKCHVTWREAQEPNGPLKKTILDKIRKQFADDPWRWKREMEADWAEDENVWLNQSLITRCIGTEKSCGQDLNLFNPDVGQVGNFYGGLDFGKHGDYTVLAVIGTINDRFFLRYQKIWPLETPYASVIGYVKQLQDRWNHFITVRADQTGIGDYIVEDMKNGGIQNVEGVTFSLPRKQEMASLLKERMQNNQFFFPYFTWEKPYRNEYVAELNVERFTLRKDGSLTLSHPQGTHDDVFWATALALYATVEMKPVELDAFRFGG
jgi:phage FluMu gp28-like protein